jgi:hypothetical protein
MTVLRVRDVIQDPDFSIPDPGIRNTELTKNLILFNPKNCYQALGNMILDVFPGSEHFPISDHGSSDKKELDPGSGSATPLNGAETRSS